MKMRNNLENYAKENKHKFDVLEPSDALWKKIEQELNSKKNKPINYTAWLSIAATIVIAIGIGFYYQTKTISMADINPDYAKKDIHYASLIEEKKGELNSIKLSNPALFEKFTNDLKALDKNYELLKKELPNSPNQQFIIKEIILNREMQLRVLMQQLNIINQVNKYTQENKSI